MHCERQVFLISNYQIKVTSWVNTKTKSQLHLLLSCFLISFKIFERLLTNSGNRRYDFAKFEFVKDCRFTSGIQPNHQDAHFFLPKEAFE